MPSGRTRLMPGLFPMVSRKPGRIWEVNSPALFAMPPVQTHRLKPFHIPGVTCESCHGVMSKGHSKKDAVMPLPITSEICRDCHKRTYQEWQISQHSQNDIRCFDCHGVHAQSLRSSGGDVLCGACHSKRLEDFAHATHQLEGLHCNSCHMPVIRRTLRMLSRALARPVIHFSLAPRSVAAATRTWYIAVPSCLKCANS